MRFGPAAFGKVSAPRIENAGVVFCHGDVLGTLTASPSSASIPWCTLSEPGPAAKTRTPSR